MDSSAPNSQQNTDSSAVQPAQPIVPNRGGIPIGPTQPASSELQIVDPILPVAESAAQKDVQSISQNDSISLMPSQSPATPSEKPANDQNVVTQAPVSQQVSSTKNREHEPSSAPAPDIVKMTDSEIIQEEKVVEKEIEAMVEKTPDSEKPKLSSEVKAAGVEHAKEDTPMPPLPTGVKPLPMSYDEAQSIRKKYKLILKDSVAWLSTLIMYHWKKIGFKNKET